jgi:hypothetical protein
VILAGHGSVRLVLSLHELLADIVSLQLDRPDPPVPYLGFQFFFALLI